MRWCRPIQWLFSRKRRIPANFSEKMRYGSYLARDQVLGDPYTIIIEPTFHAARPVEMQPAPTGLGQVEVALVERRGFLGRRPA